MSDQGNNQSRWRPSFGDIIGIAALVVAFVMWLRPPRWEWGLPITIILIGLVIFAAIRHQSHPSRRILVSISVIGILVWAAWEPIWKSFSEDYPKAWIPWKSEQQSSFPPEFSRNACGGILHRADGDLRFGGSDGEGESICVIDKADEARVLAICAVDELCRVTGIIAPCKDAGECESISRIKAVVVPPMPALPPNPPTWMQIAYKERGQTEIPGPEENHRIVEYFAAIGAKKNYRDDVDDWASAFVEWSFNKAGINGPKNDDPFAWLNWGKKVDRPRFGCVVIFSFSGLRHVGFFFRDSGDSILVLGGNQDDTVNVSRYNKSDVVGYRCPVE